LFIVQVQLVYGKATSRYPWLAPQFYTDTLQSILNRSYDSLEWALNSPPKPHAFMSLPLQSIINTVIEAAIEAAKYIDMMNEYMQSAGDAASAGDLVKANADADIAESATNKVKDIESKIDSSDIEAYKAEVGKHVKK